MTIAHYMDPGQTSFSEMYKSKRGSRGLRGYRGYSIPLEEALLEDKIEKGNSKVPNGTANREGNLL